MCIMWFSNWTWTYVSIAYLIFRLLLYNWDKKKKKGTDVYVVGGRGGGEALRWNPVDRKTHNWFFFFFFPQLCVFSDSSAPREEKKTHRGRKQFFKGPIYKIRSLVYQLGLQWSDVTLLIIIIIIKKKRGSGELQRAVYLLSPLFTASTQNAS